ncbi:hypothetical protein CALCODRAFT_515463 [Calocera cornea HHB12733]|uniref:Oxidoreductase molybdopterin-binding domain-containing protein n=1 Tax=Calocera cornea HHB12733 TaxID=1353952 RepID=A0A165I8T5_9BASI|nr:hypothetical protein CALCODRAFT_515463 [Calocera cornea HHB12733]
MPLENAIERTSPCSWHITKNGLSLTQQHGYRLCVVVPGHIGARSVQWLARIKLSAPESGSVFVQQEYMVVVPEDEGELERIEEDEGYRRWKMESPGPLMGDGIGGAIAVPKQGAAVPNDWVMCSRYAIGDNGSVFIHIQVAAVICGSSVTTEDTKYKQ